MRIIRVASTTTPTNLRVLINTAFAAKNLSVPTEQLLTIYLTPSASLTVRDARTGDGVTITARSEFPSPTALDDLVLYGTANVDVELYYV